MADRYKSHLTGFPLNRGKEILGSLTLVVPEASGPMVYRSTAGSVVGGSVVCELVVCGSVVRGSVVGGSVVGGSVARLDQGIVELTPEEAIETEIVQADEIKERIYVELSQLDHGVSPVTPPGRAHTDPPTTDPPTTDPPTTDPHTTDPRTTDPSLRDCSLSSRLRFNCFILETSRGSEIPG